MDKLPKIDRKTLKTPDQFVQRGRSVLNFLFQRRSRFVPVLIGAGVLFAGILLFDWWTERNNTARWDEYATASKLPEPEKWTKLEEFFNRGGSGRSLLFAAVDVADHYFDEAKKAALATPPNAAGIDENASRAAEWYSKALDSKGLTSQEKQLLLLNRGEAVELMKKLDDAQGFYQQAVDLGQDAKPYAQLALARIWELKNEPTKAMEIYEKVSVESQSTEFGKLAKSSLRRLKSPLLAAPSTKAKG